MALPATTVWEIRTTGNAGYGGGFVAGGTGTDYSQADAPLIAFTDLTVDATLNTKVTSAQVGFTAAHVGNIIKITGGAGFTVGWYQVVSVSAGAATLDRSPAATTTAGGTGNIGGALDGLGTLATPFVGSNKAFMKSGNYDQSALVTFATGAVTPSNTVPFSTLIGYNAVRGDITPWSANQANRPVIRNTTLNAGILAFTNAGWLVEHLALAPSGVATCGTAMLFNGGAVVVNCKASAFSVAGFSTNSSGNSEVFRCEATGGTAGNGIIAGSGFTLIHNCWSHDHTGNTVGISSAASAIILGNVVSNCTGANAIGINLTAGGFAIGNTVYKCGNSGIVLTDAVVRVGLIRGNLLAENSAYGLAASSAAMAASPLWDGNAFYGNGLGTRNNLDDTSTNVINGVAPYANSRDLALTADPFVDKTTNDFRLNAVAGGGAACRGTGIPSSWPGLAIAGYPDFGAIQHQDVGGGGGGGGGASGTSVGVGLQITGGSIIA